MEFFYFSLYVSVGGPRRLRLGSPYFVLSFVSSGEFVDNYHFVGICLGFTWSPSLVYWLVVRLI